VPRGLADAFILGEAFIDQDNVTMILGDNIFENDFSSEIKKFRKGAHVFAKKVKDPERFGVVKFDKKGKAVEIVEKPDKWISNYALTGLYVYDNRVVEVAKNVKPSDRGELEITDLNKYYLKLGELKVSTVTGEWLDAGTYDSLLEAGNIVKRKRIYKKFHPTIEKAIEEFNDELKYLAKKRLN
jgi:glucose-1-phosphate thymidylyltransferase